MQFERRRRQVHEINLTPLIDVVFHLMVFVMLTTSFVVSESMELALPSGKAATAAARVTRIEIASDGMVTLNGTAMDGNRMSGLLAGILANDMHAKIAIFTTPGVTVQQLVSVLDTVYLTGGRNVQVDRVQ